MTMAMTMHVRISVRHFTVNNSVVLAVIIIIHHKVQ